MRSRFISAAEEEFSEAVTYYENAETGLGVDFVFTILNCIDRLEKFPLLGTPTDEGFRSFPIDKFPFSIIYAVNSEEIVIFAVAHNSRRPGYWSGRL